ncbi:hypothetical protein EYF80_044986 [Liparis tanakae]|uniref:Uncharacterized protein n=1 Tax=Liparis tanakae TaxID=230148 RepID=A0A4Z2FUW1_9TELE|nr:hypothetical protein EYF80_044986 [Liparis tanakae]
MHESMEEEEEGNSLHSLLYTVSIIMQQHLRKDGGLRLLLSCSSLLALQRSLLLLLGARRPSTPSRRLLPRPFGPLLLRSSRLPIRLLSILFAPRRFTRVSHLLGFPESFRSSLRAPLRSSSSGRIFFSWDVRDVTDLFATIFPSRPSSALFSSAALPMSFAVNVARRDLASMCATSAEGEVVSRTAFNHPELRVRLGQLVAGHPPQHGARVLWFCWRENTEVKTLGSLVLPRAAGHKRSPGVHVAPGLITNTSNIGLRSSASV